MRKTTKTEHLLDDLEAAVHLLALEVKVLRGLLRQAPPALSEKEETLKALAREAQNLASQAYALEVALRRELGEDNSAETLRRELGLGEPRPWR